MSAPRESLSLRLARHLRTTPTAAVPAEALDAARRSFIDAIAVTLATGAHAPECEPFIELARAGGSGPCAVIGRGLRVPPVVAAMANGAMAHALDFEDTHDATLMHPNAAVVPAALAVVQWRDTPVSGADFLAAIALGADLNCRLARGIVSDPSAGHWYLLPMITAYGAAAAAGRLLALDEQQFVDAFSLAASQATYSAELKRSPASHLRGIRDAFGASAGVTGALLAAAGARGYDRPFEGEAGFFRMYGQDGWREEPIVAGLGREYLGTEVSYKPWPSCRGTHAHIEAALHLRDRHRIDPARIRSMHATISPIWQMLCEPAAQKREPRAEIDAKFSLPFTVATALVRGRVGLADFATDALRDPAVLALAARLDWEVNPAWTFHDSTAGELALVLDDGTRVAHRLDRPLGHPSNPLDARRTREKFAACAAHSAVPCPPGWIDEFLARCDSLERLDDVRPLLEGLAGT